MRKHKKKIKKKDLLKHEIVNEFLNIAKYNHRQGNVQKAEEAYRNAIDLDPLKFEALYLLGVLHFYVGQADSSIEFLKMAIKVNPNYSLAYNDLGVVLQQKGDVTGAIENFNKALELNSKFSQAYNNLGVSFQKKGEHEKATNYFKKAKVIDPYYFDACNNYIFALDLSETETVESLIAERKSWADIHEKPLLPTHKPHNNDLSTTRKLRIGYVSGDFRLHSASFIFGAMLTHFNKDKFEVYAYNNSRDKVDARTQFFKRSVTKWHDVTLMTDETLTELIREDQIDILVDLSGYSAGSRLLVFARKPAPVQVTAWGYTTSTGLQSIDYFFADNVIVPPEEKDLYVEEVIYLPNCANHYCPEKKPEVLETPVVENGYITFGSFNRLAKVSDGAFNLWAEVMKRIPDSKMFFKGSEFDQDFTVNRVIDVFKNNGIDHSRLIFKGETPWNEHQGNFNKIDMMLDSFPHSGGLTSVEALAQGTPVVTYAWPSFVGRVSASLLKTLEMDDWIAYSSEEYVEIAVKKANDIEQLKNINKTLPGKFLNSIIGDCDAYVNVVEQEYTKMWKKYVTKIKSS